MAEEGTFMVKKFNDQNYQLWKMQMEDYLYQKNLSLPLDGIAKKPMTMKDEEWEIDKTKLGTIRLCLVASVAFNISREKTTKDLMKALARLYEKPLASNKVFLMKHLFNMKMSEGGSIVDHLNEFNMIISQLSFVGVNFDGEVRDLLILLSLLENWKGLVMAMSNYVSISNTLKFNYVIGVFLSEEMRHKSTGETSYNALNVENRGRQRERGKIPGNRGKSKKDISKYRGKLEC